MKKFLALLLTVAMVFAMAACSAPAAEETKPAEEGTAAPAEETSEQPAAAGSPVFCNCIMGPEARFVKKNFRTLARRTLEGRRRPSVRPPAVPLGSP